MRYMLDLETLDTSESAVILSIGACAFHPVLGVTRPFYAPIFIDGQRDFGRTTSLDTEAWWSEQTIEARSVFEDPKRVDLRAALIKFSMWYGSVGTELWGNGADFDNVILGSAYASCGIKRPWSYSNNRCYRTLKNLGIKLGPGEGIERTCHHNALDDALYQAHYANEWLKKIKEKNR